jgi:hypothetical protein
MAGTAYTHRKKKISGKIRHFSGSLDLVIAWDDLLINRFKCTQECDGNISGLGYLAYAALLREYAGILVTMITRRMTGFSIYRERP